MVLNLLNFTSSLLMLFFVQLLSGNSVINWGAVAFTFMHTFVKILSSSLNGAMLTGNVTCNLQNSRYFWCPVWKLMKLIKSELTQKLKHTNSILEYFEYYCQISSKLIHTISSYTVSKLGRFFETQCIWPWNYLQSIPTCVKNIPQLHRQTNGRTDYLLWHNCTLCSIAQ